MADPISAALFTVADTLLATSATGAISGLTGTGLALAGGLGAKALAPKAPGIQKPALMPTPNDDQVRAAKRRQIAEVQARSGRASTILSQADVATDDKLGG